MAAFKLLITLLLLACPTNWALSMTSSDSLLVSSKSPLSSSNTKDSAPAPASSSTAAATLGDLYRKSRQSRCVRCYDDRYGDDYERNRYNSGPSGGAGSIRGPGPGPIPPSGGYSSYPSRTYDERPGNWYYPRETNERYDESRVGYSGSGGGGSGRENDRNEDRYNTRTYDRYERDRYDSRYSHERSPSETRAYGHGYESRDRYYPGDRSNDYYRGDRYSDRSRGSSSGSDGSIYDRYGQDDRYLSRYDYRNYRPWDETYRGQSGFDNSGRGYYFANERPNDYYEPPPPPPPPQYGPYSRPLGPSGPGPSTPGPTYLPRDPHEQSRPSNSHHGYPDDRPGSSSSPSSSSSSSSGSSSSGPDYGNRPRDDVHGHGSGSGGGGGGNGGGNGGSGGGGATGSGGDNKNGYSGGSWSYVNDREKDASYKGGIRDKDNQSSPYGGGRGRPSLSGSYLLDRENNNIPETSLAINPDKPSNAGDSHHQISDSPTASKLTSPSSSSTSKLATNEDRVTESKGSN
ncbi:WW domain-containing adapter protein with coiled-coil homolog isoform X2 [Eupeodes corollae]|uniref:WW domain-containing adapter protein with coiled-coil homolog isoform X2 n=1 Tax=Eupeodes corollae TaxID=290404 RepID=UPI00248F54E8|nr:WW domain-containing adapter protein with coiled-coil homolog isoform X2 [Eupeodes corollae]